MKFRQFMRGVWERTHVSARFGAMLTAGLIATLVVLNVVIYGLANRFGWYPAAEEHLAHTITGNTDAYLAEVAGRGNVKFIFCDNPENLENDGASNLVWQTVQQYAARYSFISVETVNIYTNPEKVESYKYKTDPDTGEKTKINSINRDSVIVTGAADFVVLSMSMFFVLDEDKVVTAYNGEEIAAAMIHRVQIAEKPKAYFTVSHGETYSSAFYDRVLCAGYDMTTVDLMTEELTGGTGDLLIISSPQYDFVRGNADRGIISELEKIEAFLGAGGSVFVMLDPLVTNTVFLEDFLTDWGITVERAVVDGVRESVMVRDSADSVTTDGYALITTPSGSEAADEIAAGMSAAGAGRVIVSQASPMTLTEREGKEVSAILTTSSSSRAYAAGKPFGEGGSFTVAAMSRDKASGGGVFAVSSSYLTAQDAVTTNEYGNRDMIFSLFRQLAGVSVPTGCTYLLVSPTSLEDLTMREARLWTVLLVGVIPLGVAACGVVILRKRRYR